MSIDMLRRQRRKKQLQKWLTWSMMAEAFFIALSPILATMALMAGLILTAWKVRAAGGMEFRHLPFDVPVALFILLGAASIIVSPDKGFSFYNYYHLVGVYVLTYLFIGQNVTTKEQVKKIVLALGVSAVVVVLYGFYQYAFGIDISEMRWVDGEAFPDLNTRVFSTWENPNILAGYLGGVLCVLLGFFTKCGNNAQKLVLALGMMLAAACLAMTYARGACLAVAVVFLGYGLLKDRRVFLACLAAGGILLLTDPALYGRLASVFTSMDTSSEMRLAFWEATVAMIQDHPFLGIGWGAYWMVYPEYDFYMQGSPIKIVHAHNIYLNYMAEIGIAGAVAFFWYFFGTMRLCLGAKILPEKKDFPETSWEAPFPKTIEGREQEGFLATLRGDAEERDHGEDPDAEEKEAADAPTKIGTAEGATKEAKEEKITEKAIEEAEEQEDAAEEPESEDEESADVSSSDGEDGDKEETAEKEEEEKAAPVKEQDAEGSEAKDTEAKEAEAEGAEEEQAPDEESEGTGEPEEKAEPSETSEVEEEETAEKEEAGEGQEEDEKDDEDGNGRADTAEEDGAGEASRESQGDADTEIKAVAEEPKAWEEDLSTGAGNHEEDVGAETRKSAFKTTEEYWEDLRNWEDRRFRAGLSLGIGLAFVSAALNGLTDDLLFNIPTSMLLWFLASLGAVNAGFDEEKL